MSDNDEPDFPINPPRLTRMPRLTRIPRVEIGYDISGNDTSTDTASTIRNISRGSTPELNTDDDLDFNQESRPTTPFRETNKLSKNPWAYESDSEGGKLRKRYKTIKRKTYRRKTYRRKSNKRKTYRRNSNKRKSNKKL